MLLTQSSCRSIVPPYNHVSLHWDQSIWGFWLNIPGRHALGGYVHRLNRCLCERASMAGNEIAARQYDLLVSYAGILFSVTPAESGMAFPPASPVGLTPLAVTDSIVSDFEVNLPRLCPSEEEFGADALDLQSSVSWDEATGTIVCIYWIARTKPTFSLQGARFTAWNSSTGIRSTDVLPATTIPLHAVSADGLVTMLGIDPATERPNAIIRYSCRTHTIEQETLPDAVAACGPLRNLTMALCNRRPVLISPTQQMLFIDSNEMMNISGDVCAAAITMIKNPGGRLLILCKYNQQLAVDEVFENGTVNRIATVPMLPHLASSHDPRLVDAGMLGDSVFVLLGAKELWRVALSGGDWERIDMSSVLSDLWADLESLP